MLWKLKSIFNYFLRRFIQVMQLVNLPKGLCVKLNDIRHRLIMKELSPILNKSYEVFKKKNIEVGKNSGIIWTFWWQGYKNMPPIVKSCFKALIKNSNNYKVILITKYNIKRYASLPFYIYNRVNDNQLSLTHLSDILRFNLLRKYGGIWIDATVLCVYNLTKKYFGKFYTSNVGYDKYHYSVSCSRWTSFLIGGDKGLPFFIFMDIFFKIYWRIHNCVIDYFMMDYVIYYAYVNNIDNLHLMIDDADRQPNMLNLMPLMGKRYNFHQYKLLKNNTQFFKLTYKKKLKNIKMTYYDLLLNGKLQ